MLILGRVDEYAAWVKGLDFVEVTNAELVMQHLSQLKDNTFKINLMLPLKVSRDMFERFSKWASCFTSEFLPSTVVFF